MIFCHVFCTLFSVASIMILAQGQDELCIGVTCNGRGTCSPNPEYSRGYWCQCEEGWAGQDCLHPEPSVTCDDDRITVNIDKGLVRELGIADEPRNVYFGMSSGGQQCRATDADSMYRLIIRAPFSSCGTQVIQQSAGDDYTFSNTVVWSGEESSLDDLIDRELILLDFKCIYEDTYSTFNPPLLPEANVLHLVTERGEFDVRMRLFDDESYSTSHEYTESPLIPIGTYVFVQVELDHILDKHLVVTVDRCFASQSHDPADPISTKHILITDRCANPNDSTIHIVSNGESPTSRFKFQMFKWRWSADDVYLHCEVDICNKTSESCTGDQTSCKGSTFLRKRRDVISHEGVYDPKFVPHAGRIISQGPIYVETDDLGMSNAQYDDQDSEVDTSVLALALVLGMVLLIVGMVGGVFARRSLKARKLRAKQEASTKRLTSFHFTTESF